MNPGNDNGAGEAGRAPSRSVRRAERLLARCGAAAMLITALGCGKSDDDDDDVVVKPVSAAAKPNTKAHVSATPKFEAIEAARAAIPGGQVLLADDQGFDSGEGWGAAAYTEDHQSVSRWTVGKEQRVTWVGPSAPGDYLVRAIFWRPQPFPQENIQFEYRLPGMTQWATASAGMDGVAVDSRLTVTTPGRELTAEFKVPTWIPSERFPGSNDSRELSMDFVKIEVAPLQAPSAAAAPAVPEAAAPAPTEAAPTEAKPEAARPEAAQPPAKKTSIKKK